MTGWKKGISAAFMAAAFGVLSCGTAAARTREAVGKVSLVIGAEAGLKEENGEVFVTPDGENAALYTVEDVFVTNEDGEGFRNTNPPEAEITLSVNDDEAYYFSETGSKGFKLRLSERAKSRYDKAEFVRASRENDSSTLVLTIRLLFDEDADTGTAPVPSAAGWSADRPGTACWNEVSGAKYYQLQLVFHGSWIGETRSIYGTSYDFSGDMENPGEYRYLIRSVSRKNNNKSGWQTSDALALKEDGTMEAVAGECAGQWMQAADGVRFWWLRADGTYPAGEWLKEGGRWYHFDEEGYMQTGWITVDGKEYYLDPESGAMYENTVTPDGYFVGPDGARIVDTGEP